MPSNRNELVTIALDRPMALATCSCVMENSLINLCNASLQLAYDELRAEHQKLTDDHSNLYKQLARTQANSTTLTQRLEDQQKTSQQVHDHLNHLQASYDNYQQATTLTSKWH